jgi:transaldolase
MRRTPAVGLRRDGQRDGYVSLEVSPALCRRATGTLEEARRLWTAVDRPNWMVKVPASAVGFSTIQQLISEGININVTMLFSQDAYAQSPMRMSPVSKNAPPKIRIGQCRVGRQLFSSPVLIH